MFDAIADVPGILVGHDTDLETRPVAPSSSVRQRARRRVWSARSAPGTRESDLLRPGHLVERVHAILLICSARLPLTVIICHIIGCTQVT
jgi:L-aminopeptidase/D-esterase-like protein